MTTTHQKAYKLNKLANEYATQMRYSQAIVHYKQALSLYVSLAKEDPIDYCLAIAHIFSNLSIIYLSLEQPRKSNEFHQNALRMHRVLCKTNPKKYALELANCLIDGVRYLKEHPFTLYEAEMVLNHVDDTRRIDELVRVIRKLHAPVVES
ncbi:MAG: Unknown protein [uncultured Sulfurovum sp.]|uniref:Tetratricopeptide repeat protein n=1 Tax=uncultured Sulfurovum sp. TaxID=269237 RepID=A0A6S6T995_9BACT|nr:MAG: Unknown protein [uncultured Sulfurovum sp.]